MKQCFYYLFVAMMMAVFTTGLTACGDDSDEPEGGDIVGTWSSDLGQEIINAMDGIYSSGEDLIQFKEDGTYVEVSVLNFTKEWADFCADDEDFKNPEIEIDRGTYTISGNTLTLYYSDGTKEVCTVNIKGKSMTVTTTYGLIISTTFTKVSDSVINKYLH